MPPFSKIKTVRLALREHAEELYQQYMDTILRAKSAGEHEVALKALQWLISHMPPDEDGTKLIEPDIDKQQPTQLGSTGPSIQIGIQVGGTGKALPKPKVKKALPSVKVETIDQSK